MEGDFVQVQPPTFELWYTGDMQYSGKPISTKLTVTLQRLNEGVQVKATASTNKMFYVVSAFIVIGLIVNLFKTFTVSSIFFHLIALIVFVVWDQWAKARAFKRLEQILS